MSITTTPTPTSTPPAAPKPVVDHKLELSELMGALLKESLNSDVTFLVEGQSFRAHRAILAIQSPVLRKMLLEPSLDFRLDEPIQLPERSHGVRSFAERRSASFTIFLRYLYTGLFNVGDVEIAVAADVLALAHEYQVENLESSLGEALKAFVNIETVFTLFQVAFEIEAKGLLTYCRDFMCENAKAVVRSSRFGKLSEKAVIDILSNDFFAAPEFEILRAITLWHESNSDVKLNGIFDQVRFELVSLDGWSLIEVAPVCKLLNAYDIDLKQAVSLSTEDGMPKRPRYMLATSNQALSSRGAVVLSEGRVRHGSYMIDGSYFRRQQGDAAILGYETKIKGTAGYVVVKLAKVSFVNSLRIVASNRCTDPHAVVRPDGYKIFTSMDNTSWDLLVDCRNMDCSGCKVLAMFPTRPIQYIRIVSDAKTDSDYLYVLNLMCPAEVNDTDIVRFKALCSDGQTLVYIPSQDREIVF